MFDKLTDRVLELFGLDLDYTIDICRDPFNAITDDLFLGARPEREVVPALEEAGVTHVVSCLPEQQRAKVGFLGEHFHPLFIPMHDGMCEDIASVFPAFFEFVDGAAERAGAKVLVHCEVGVSRSATLVTALVMRRRKMRFFDAFCQVRAKRGEVLPNIGFATQLHRFELELFAPKEDDRRLSSLARYLKEVCMVPVDIETLQTVLDDQDYDALKAIRAMFGDEIPRVIQGARF